MKRSEQLCWTCKKATGFCSWSSRGVPVKNWTATPTVYMDEGNKIRSYSITACPQYEKDDRRIVKDFERISFKELAKLLQVGYRMLRDSTSDKIKGISLEKGISLKIVERHGRRSIYLDNQGGVK